MKTAFEIFREHWKNHKVDKELLLSTADQNMIEEAMDEYANQYKDLLKELLPMAEDGYNGYVKSGSCHQEFLSEDRELLSRVRAVLAVSPLNTKTNESITVTAMRQ